MKATFRNIGEQIIEQLKSVDNSVLIAVAWFTNEAIFDILLDLLRNGKSVELIVNNDTINNRQDGLNFNQFIKQGGKFYFADNSRLMHNKFAVIDNSKIISGSYNWTYNAEFRNSENIVMTYNLETIEEFKKEFALLKTNGQQQTEVIIPLATTSDIAAKEYLKEDYFAKSILEEKKGNMKKSQKAIQSAQELDPENKKITERALEIQKKIEKPKYDYHVEDGQFSFDFSENRLIGKEGEIIKLFTDRSGDTEDEIYILFIDGFYVECVGNIERSFPANKQEHEELKQQMIKMYEEL
ncbi:MAG: hypothetical protein EPN92_11630 [Chitinophagaceae bacterium]|nr:MAG: hypothetical protein EPN92_11630 [Chitinophagaceae bacterium]